MIKESEGVHLYPFFSLAMIEAKLFRFQKSATYTMGALVIGGETFYVLERPWLNNACNISCIPTGKYTVAFMSRSASGKYKKVYHVLNVEGRTGILIHNGNLVRHSLGCLLVGLRAGVLGGQPAVLSSKAALRKLNKLTGEQGFTLEVM